ncbi:hypothetical protein EYF80_029068 [Liparis tanakae]|uniref:Uncharacterized protein n=1 Tax=Liparis tanakae TaxID=230148 RepID=A0A4Z2H7C0_9TELE|nr:hypothetical protein EYF80_029068 [Liparis tanakae]
MSFPECRRGFWEREAEPLCVSRLGGASEAGPIRSPQAGQEDPALCRRRSAVLTNFTTQNHERQAAARGERREARGERRQTSRRLHPDRRRPSANQKHRCNNVSSLDFPEEETDGSKEGQSTSASGPPEQRLLGNGPSVTLLLRRWLVPYGLVSAFTAETGAAWPLVSGQRCGRELSEPRTPHDPEPWRETLAKRCVQERREVSEDGDGDVIASLGTGGRVQTRRSWSFPDVVVP